MLRTSKFLHRRPTLKKITFGLLVLLLVSVSLVAFAGNKASAAEVDNATPCATGPTNFTLNPPFKLNGVDYSCAYGVNVNEGDAVLATDGQCPAATGGGFMTFGLTCLVKATVRGGEDGGGGGGKLTPVKLPQPASNSGKRCGAEFDDKGEKNPAQITPAIDLGCRGKGNGILDLIFAIIRLLSMGVGLVVVGSIIVAGIQYTSSRGDPQATANAMKRISSTVIALLIYIFAFALLNWLIPGAVLK